MTHELPPAARWRRLRHPRWWLAAFLLAACAWAAWREYDYRAAIREAQAAGFWWTSREPFDLISEDWRAAFHEQTWTYRYRNLGLKNVPDLAQVRNLLHRLRPTGLDVSGFQNVDLDALRELSELEMLGLGGCAALQNVDILSRFTRLETLCLSACTSLKTVDSLKGLSALRHLDLAGCTGIPASALRDLRAALPSAYIIFPNGSTTPPP